MIPGVSVPPRDLPAHREWTPRRGGTVCGRLASMAQPVTVLFLAAQPHGAGPLRPGSELRAIQEALARSALGDRFRLESLWAASFEDLRAGLHRFKPAVVHFSGHGHSGALLIEGPDGKVAAVAGEALAGLFAAHAHKVRLVLFNACDSLPAAQAVAPHVDCAVGTDERIRDRGAAVFAGAFYEALGFGRSVAEAVALGRNAVLKAKIENAGEVKVVPGPAADEIFLVHAAGGASTEARLAHAKKRISLILSLRPALVRLLSSAFAVEDREALTSALFGQGQQVVDHLHQALDGLDGPLDPGDIRALDDLCQALLPAALDFNDYVEARQVGRLRLSIHTEALAEVIMAGRDGGSLSIELSSDAESELTAAARVPLPSTVFAPFLDLNHTLLQAAMTEQGALTGMMIRVVADYFRSADTTLERRRQFARGKLRSRLAEAPGRRRTPYLTTKEGQEALLRALEAIIDRDLPGLALVHLACQGFSYEDETYLVDRIGNLLRRLRLESRP